MRLTLFEPFRFARLATRRASTDAALLAGVAAAVLVATTVIGGAPIYLASLDKVAVRSTIDNESLVGRNVTIVNDGDVQVRIPVLDDYTANVEMALEQQLGDISGPMRQVILPPHHVRIVDPEAPPLTVQDFTAIRFEYVESADEHVTYVVGRPPGEITNPGPDDAVIEVGLWVDHILVDIDRITVGEEYVARTLDGPGDQITFRLTGLFEVHDPTEDFWMNRARALTSPDPLEGFFGPVPGFFINRQALERIAEAGPYGRLTASWILPINSAEIRELEADDISNRVDGLYGMMQSNAPGSTVLTGLGNSFDALSQRLAFSRIPMALMATLLLVFVGYYLYMTSRSLAERRQAEMGVIQSRGGSLAQVGRLYGVESLVIVGIPVLIGPLLALVLISQAGRLPLYGDVTDGGALPVTLGWESYAFSLAAGLIALIVVIGPALVFGHGSVVAGKRDIARPDETPFIHRYFLDIALLAGAGYLAWELNLRGGVPVSVSNTGEITTDNAILFLPALLLAGVSLAFLRLFPLTMRLLAYLLTPVAPTWGVIALWRLSRSPYSYAAIIVFLMLAAGMVAVAGTLSSTLRQSAVDRAEYAVGADVRVRIAGGEQAANRSVDEIVEPIRGLAGVAGVSAVLRAPGGFPGATDQVGFDVLAVQPDQFGRIATFRSDFSDLSLDELMESIEVVGRIEPIFLPENADQIGVWMRTEDSVPNLFMWARIRTADGLAMTITLGAIEAGPWSFKTASLDGLRSPVQLLGIQVFEGTSGTSGSPAVVMIDDVSGVTITEDGDRTATVVASFDEQGAWRALPTNRGVDSAVGLFRGGDRGVVARFEMGRGTNGGTRGIYRPDIEGPIPVIISDRLAAETGLEIDVPVIITVGGTLAEVIPTATVELFPTMSPDTSSGFMVIDVEAIARYAEVTGGNVARSVDEVLIGLKDGADSQSIASISGAFPGLVSIVNRQSVSDASLVDPLAVAGWRGVGVLGGAIALLVVVAGYLTYLSAYSSRMRLQGALLRSLGVSTAEFTRILIVEHLLVGAMGIALGTLAGLAMSRIAVSASVRTANGDEVLPPFNVLTEWLPVSAFFLVLAVAALVGVIGMVLSFRREQLHESTRLEA
ncbi:MAG: hypothetical protein HOB07_12240 [Chloroflexi bacterium]|nr:hypothetical protein [Chloroflexota bacterium]